jgi:sulfoxide reductase heme-binding subunit YedZ
MKTIKKIINNHYVFWLVISLPALPMIIGFVTGNMQFEELMHETGEFSARFVVAAMLITPFIVLFPTRRWPRWLLARRRYLGVAAFAYGLLHTVIYLLDAAYLDKIIDDALRVRIWTGWVAMLIFLPLAMTSNNRSVRAMGPAWKKLQRWVYLAAFLSFAHWVIIGFEIAGALAHFAPLAIFEALRIWKRRKKPSLAS